MINKKLKDYLQHNITKPRITDTQQMLLKLKALQKSRQKSHHKSNSYSDAKSKKHSQSIMQTTQSTFLNSYTKQNSRKSSKPKQKQININQENQSNFISIDKQIKLLQSKVDILLCNKDIEIQATSKRALSASQQKQKKYVINNISKEGKSNQKQSQKLISPSRNSFQNKKKLFHHTQSPQNPRYLITIQMQASKLLTNLQINPIQVHYFQTTKNIQQVFYTLQNILSIVIARRILQTKHKTSQQSQHQIDNLQIQKQALKTQSQFLHKQVSQLRQDRQNMMDRMHTLSCKKQQLQTEIFRLRSLYQQSQNSIIRRNLQFQQIQNNHKQIVLQYQQRLHTQLNKLQHQQTLHQKLKQKLQQQSSLHKQYKFDRQLLTSKLQKIQRDYLTIKQRHQIQKTQKQQIQQQQAIQLQIYRQYHQGIKDAYFGLVDQLSTQITIIRKQNNIKQQQLKQLQKKVKQYQRRIQQFQEDYLCLNCSYTKQVQQWVAKQENYQQVINQLREQLVGMHQTVGNYSKMLASSVRSNVGIDINKF